MQKILTGYIVKKFLLIFLASLVSLTAIIMLFDLVELLRIAGKKENIAFLDVLTLALLKSPQMIHIILPFVVLLAGMIFFLVFNRTSELIVIRSVGMSAWNVLFPLCTLVFVIGVLDVLVFSPISAKTARRYERLEERLGMTTNTPFVWSEDGFWWRENTGNGTLVIRASQVKQNNGQMVLSDVTLINLSAQDLSQQLLEAKSARLEKGALKIKEAFLVDAENEKITTQKNLSFNTSLNMERLLEKFDEPQTMSFWRFPHFIKFLKKAGFSVKAHEMYFYELTVFPLFLVTMLMIAALFTLPPSNRRGGIFVRVLLVLGCGFCLYFFTRITNVMGQSDSLPMWLAAWGPSLVCLPLCVSALLHLEDG